jgi:hypothetical protein
MAKKVIKLKAIKKVVLPTKEQLHVRVDQLHKERVVIGNKLIDLIEKANRLAEAHIECKEQMRAAELDLIAVGKEIRTVNKRAAEAK